MGASILAPVTGDKPSSPVPFTIDYDFAAATDLTCFVAGDHDAPQTVPGGTRGTHTTSVATAQRGMQRVSVKNGAAELHFWVDVEIVDPPPPVIIIDTPQEKTKDNLSSIRVRGKCNPKTLPKNPFITCIAYLVRPENTQTPVAMGYAFPDKNGKWNVTLKFKKYKTKSYVARAFLSDHSKPTVVIGANSKVM